MDKWQADQMTHRGFTSPFASNEPQRTVADIIANPWARVNPPSGMTPSATQNAVAITMSPDYGKNSQGNVRKTEQGSSSPRAPSAAGYAAGSEGSVSPGGTPYVTRKVGEGIERIDTKGQSPLFTNMGGAGLDDINRMGPQLPSVPGFLAGVKSFGSGAVAGAQSAQGGGNFGMIPPSLMSQIDSLDSEARPLLSSRGIVDRLRGRQLMRTRSRLLADMANTMQAGAQVGAVGVAQQNANTSAFNAQETMAQNLAQNALKQQELKAQMRGQDLSFLPHLGQAAAGMNIAKAFKEGNMNAVLDTNIAMGGRREPVEKQERATPDPMGRGFLITPATGKSYLMTYEDMLKQRSNPQQEETARALYGK